MKNLTDEQILAELGIAGANDQVKELTLNALYGSVNIRVMQRITDQLSDEQLAELDKHMKDGDATMISMIESMVPTAKDIIDEEMREAIQEIKAK